MSSELELAVKSDNKSLSVRLIGKIGYLESNQFQSQLEELLDKDESVIFIDCSELSFISSAGLRVILKFAKQIPEKNKKLALYALQKNVEHVFDVSGFSKILNIYPDRQQAEANVLNSCYRQWCLREVSTHLTM